MSNTVFDVVDCPDDPDEAGNYSQELLHGMTPTSLPPTN